MEEIHKIASDNPEVVVIKKSIMEKHTTAISALCLTPEINPPVWYAKMMQGEVGHIHMDVDGSAHVTLSLADAREVIEKGWGERQAFTGNVLPWGYTMIYAPRNRDEVEVLGKIFRAGIAFVSGGKDVR